MDIRREESTRIYSIQVERRASRYASVLGLLFGAVFLGWYALNVPSAIANDIRNFPASFRSEPVLTIAFAVLKFLGYILFPYVAGMWVYVPIKDFVGPRARKGKLAEVASLPVGTGGTWWASFPLLGWLLAWGMPVPVRPAMTRIRVGEWEFNVPDAPELGQVLRREELLGQEVVFTLGALNRVLSIERIPPLQ